MARKIRGLKDDSEEDSMQIILAQETLGAKLEIRTEARLNLSNANERSTDMLPAQRPIKSRGPPPLPTAHLPSFLLAMAEGTEETDFHPLENEWVLWEHAGGATKDPNKWKENMKELCSFNSIEGFWRYFNHIPRPSEVFFDGDSRKRIGPEGKTVEEYSLFKRGIEPEWGDPKNVTGGEWFCRQYFEGDVLDLYWQNLVLAVVGEVIEDGHGEVESHVNGARVVDKGRGYPMFRLELWINTRNPDVKERIRQKMVDVMTDGQPPSRKAHPKFDWKDHSS